MEEKMKISAVLGIDPGSNGGIAVYQPGYNVKVYKMPKDIADLRDLLMYYAGIAKPIVFLEKLSVRPDDIQIDSGNKAANMGKLFRIQNMMANYEHLKALIEVAEIPYVMVHPASWQSKLKLRLHGQHEEKADRKRRFKEVAAKLYPGVNVTLWNSDALLIMHFGRWALVNDQKWVKANLPQREHDKLF